MDASRTDGPNAQTATTAPRAAATAVAPQSPPAPAKPAQPAQPSGESSVRETIESILVAFILAFIFRAFIVEAFVIPTGSMAPTLLGAHIRFNCDDCGYRFTVNYRAAETPDGKDVIIPATAGKVYRAICPNCGFQVPQFDATDQDSDATNPPVHYGDRILVLKYLYLFQDPQRYDVVVFKSPASPKVYKYEQNYIKRLVGTPGESVLLLDGDVYTAESGADHTTIANYRIRPKPRHAQDVLWRVIYDNDYHPRRRERPDGEKWKQPWTPIGGGGWKLDVDGGRTFRFDGADARGALAFDPRANPETHAFTDWLAYDVEEQAELVPVSDLKLDLYYQRTAGDGPLRLKLARGDDVFIAEITPSDVKLLRAVGTGAPAQLAAAELPEHAKGQPLHVEFENVDYQVTLRVDVQTLLQTTPAQYAPDPAALLSAFRTRADLPRPSVQIEAERQTADLRHLSLWRDIYYTNRRNPGQGSPIWATPANFPDGVIRLGLEEYFVLGDNSLVSGDARYWRDDIDLPDEDLFVESGRVPGRFMLGKAFFVYWPAGYRPARYIPALTPNFGEMRFIR